MYSITKAIIDNLPEVVLENASFDLLGADRVKVLKWCTL